MPWSHMSNNVIVVYNYPLKCFQLKHMAIIEHSIAHKLNGQLVFKKEYHLVNIVDLSFININV